ncbi:MAG: hypothetical protein ACREJ4_09350 [Candidatus Methylomirabilaceae bacterium]
MMVRKSSAGSAYRVAASAVAVALALTLLVLAPFAAALEVHHALAAADYDGHQHSDSDLCQWVQHHTSNSLQTVVSVLESFFAITSPEVHAPLLLLSFQSHDASSPRAPPLS